MRRSLKPYQNEHDSVKPTKCSEKEKNKQGNKTERTGKERKGKEKEKEESLLLSVHVRNLQANNNYSASGSEGRQVYDL